MIELGSLFGAAEALNISSEQNRFPSEDQIYAYDVDRWIVVE